MVHEPPPPVKFTRDVLECEVSSVSFTDGGKCGLKDWRDHIDQKESGVWRYAPLMEAPGVATSSLSLGDTAARYDSLSVQDSPFESLLCQREDLNPNGSHKDRSLAIQVNSYRAEGFRSLCISSSGNAAIAAAAACKAAQMTLFAFMSPQTRPGKIRAVLERGGHVILSSRAIGLAKSLAASHGLPNLRPSVDDRALEGYKSLAFYLAESGRNEQVDSIFCYTTSGSTLCGIWRGFQTLSEGGWKGPFPGLHAAQAGEITSIAERFGEKPAQKGRSVIGDLGTKRTRRLGELVRAIRASQGHAWALSDAEILQAKSWLEIRGIGACLESACSMAAALKAGERGVIKNPLVLLTGHVSRDDMGEIPEEEVKRIDTEEAFFEAYGRDLN